MKGHALNMNFPPPRPRRVVSQPLTKPTSLEINAARRAHFGQPLPALTLLDLTLLDLTLLGPQSPVTPNPSTSTNTGRAQPHNPPWPSLALSKLSFDQV